MVSLRQLYDLQQLDLHSDRQRAALAALKTRLGESPLVHQLRSQQDNYQQRVQEVERFRRSLELDLAEVEGKLKEVTKRLYGGSVRNPKELLALEQEADIFRRRKDGLETQLLELMARAEQLEADLRDLAQQLEREEATWRSEQQKLQEQIQAIEAQLRSLEEERQGIASAVDPPTLGQYETLRSRRHGVAVAKVQGGLCQGCRIAIPVNDLRLARLGREVVLCNSCGRILYAS